MINGRRAGVPETLITAVIVLFLVLASTVLSLRLTSPELSWDEADYTLAAEQAWGDLTYSSPHLHGPLMLYLIKLGREGPFRSVGSVEDQSRLLLAFLGSLAVGVTYWGLRHVFAVSRLAAMAGANLLMLSDIRLRETYIAGPHYPFLLWTLCICILGYRWRDNPTLRPALCLGLVFGLAASTMVYCIPLALCWIVAIVLSNGKWLDWDKLHLKIPWMTIVLLGTAILVVTVVWRPSVRYMALLDSFKYYARSPSHPTLVGEEIIQKAPHTAYLYWLWHLDFPILFAGVIVLASFVYRAIRTHDVTVQQRFLFSFLGVLLSTALTAYVAGARNLLLFIGVLCLAAGAAADDLIRGRWRRKVLVAAVAIIGPVVNLVAVRPSAGQIPELFWNGYRSFVVQNRELLSQPGMMIVDGGPMLKFYAEQSGTPMTMQIWQMPWTTWPGIQLPDGARYALLSELTYRHMPSDIPERRVIDRNWKVVWSFKENGSWGLRLYERQ